MPPRKRVQSLVINYKALAAPLKEGKENGKALIGERSDHKFGSDRESAQYQPSFLEHEDDQPLITRLAEIRARVCQDPSWIIEPTHSAADTVPSPA